MSISEAKVHFPSKFFRLFSQKWLTIQLTFEEQTYLFINLNNKSKYHLLQSETHLFLCECFFELHLISHTSVRRIQLTSISLFSISSNGPPAFVSSKSHSAIEDLPVRSIVGIIRFLMFLQIKLNIHLSFIKSLTLTVNSKSSLENNLG